MQEEIKNIKEEVRNEMELAKTGCQVDAVKRNIKK